MLNMKITVELQKYKKKYSIETDSDDHDLPTFIDKLIIPLLLAMEYSPKTIERYFNGEE